MPCLQVNCFQVIHRTPNRYRVYPLLTPPAPSGVLMNKSFFAEKSTKNVASNLPMHLPNSVILFAFELILFIIRTKQNEINLTFLPQFN